MEVKMAYQLLTDSQKRQQYDRQQQVEKLHVSTAGVLLQMHILLQLPA